MKILHLYYDIMNLYGEYGNISALERVLQKSNVEITTDRLTLGDSADLESYDFIYVGSGTESNQKLVLEDFKKYRDSLASCIENGIPILMTGNSFEMLGKTITDCNGKAYDGLGIFDFTSVEQNKKRLTGDVICTADFSTKPFVGFINKCSEISGITSPLFTVKHGMGNNSESKSEGLHCKNLFGTHVTGPIMIKNPHFLLHIADIISKRNQGFEVCANHLDYERKGYKITLNELSKRFEE